MNSSDLTPHQIAALRAHAEREYRHLATLRTRMSEVGFPVTDPLRVKADSAMAATYDFYLTLANWGKPVKVLPDLSKMTVD